ncbi:MAG: hypothetical protein K8R54_01375 [Bacteroidales bacterium]|nr:hypothetical protein [Bacteroidales bacterium]
MTDFNKIFFDTAPLIYLIEKNDKFYEQTKNWLAQHIKKDTKLFTSVVTIAEFGVKPYKSERLDIIKD